MTVPEKINESGNENGYHCRTENENYSRLRIGHRVTVKPVPILLELLPSEPTPLR
jgi:hypothetical protein